MGVTQSPDKGKAIAIKLESKKRKTPHPPKQKEADENVTEKRLLRFRKQCPKSIMERVDRVMSQRMYMVNRQQRDSINGSENVFQVLGSTGNVYTVVISKTPTCDCPDRLKGNSPCKHIIFIFLKVLKAPIHSTGWYQKALLSDELQAILDAAPAAPGKHVTVTSEARKAYLVSMGEEPETESREAAVDEGGERKRLTALGDDCPVCFEEMTSADHEAGTLIFDEAEKGCGKPLHKECFYKWAPAAKQRKGTVTCVWCQGQWEMAGKMGGTSAGMETSALGYFNMASMMGMSRQRDTSSYYHGPMRGVPMWKERYLDD